MGSINQSSNQIKWQTATLPQSTKKALDFLRVQEWLRKSLWYLAGGTALALYEGHRTSVDLDFFIQKKDFDIQTLLSKFSEDLWTSDIVKEGTVYGRLFNAKMSFIAYPFFIPKAETRWYGAIRILAPRDIAVMKIIAISQRGKKRDFVDLYYYVRKYEPLGAILLRLPEQYPTVAHDYHHILKSMMYFADADEDPMPKIFFNATWKEIKQYFQHEIPRITKEFLELK